MAATCHPRIGKAAGDQLDRVVVGQQAGQARVGDPLQQLGIAPVQAGARLVDQLRVGLLLHLEQHIRKAGVQAHHVALLDLYLVFFQNSHQVSIANGVALASEVVM